MSSIWRSGADLVIEPDVAGYAYDDFKRADDLIRVGEAAMRAALPEVRKWIQTAPEPELDIVPAPPQVRSAPMPAD